MEIHDRVFVALRAENNYASYRGKPVKFITFVVRLPEETSAGNNWLFFSCATLLPTSSQKGRPVFGMKQGQ